jgi:hypothetical protein
MLREFLYRRESMVPDPPVGVLEQWDNLGHTKFDDFMEYHCA